MYACLRRSVSPVGVLVVTLAAGASPAAAQPGAACRQRPNELEQS